MLVTRLALAATLATALLIAVAAPATGGMGQQ
jgi:hypothetical protein